MGSDHSTAVDRPDGLVLAGGRGRRVGGADKGLLPFHGSPAAAAAVAALRPLCRRVLISANRHRSAYAALDADAVVPDLRADYAGPLAGLEAVRALCAGPCLLVLPCDMPLLTPDIPARLHETLRGNAGLDAVYARARNRDHFLVCAITRAALCGISARLDRGEAAVRTWLAELRTQRLDLSDIDQRVLGNLNRRADWDGV